MKGRNVPASGRAGYRCALIAVAAGLAAASAASAQSVRYTVKDLGALPGATSVSGRGINDAGDAVGRFVGADHNFHGFIWHEGTMTQIKSLGNDPTDARAVNHDGLIAGSSLTSAGQQHAFLRKAGVTIDLGTLGGAFSVARGINGLGVVAGEAQLTGNPGFTHAAIWGEDRHAQDLGTFGGEFSQANALNDAGLVVGWAWNPARQQRAFLVQPGSAMLDLGDLGVASGIAATAISSNKLVAGFAPAPGQNVGDTHAFLWSDGVIRDLGLLPEAGTRIGELGPELISSKATGVNSAGVVVGNSTPGTPVPPLRPGPFVWQAGVMTNLNDLVQGGAGFIITEANGINEAGQIIGTAIVPAGGVRAVILTPVACFADCDASGTLTVNDFVCFGQRFAAANPAADCDASGTLTVNDFVCFQQRFAAGCP